MPEPTAPIHWDILDQKRQAILPLFNNFKDNFYLAGGTGLALQLGHRDSADFDFFSEQPFETDLFFRTIEPAFPGHQMVKTQEEHNTLTALIDETIKITFFSYPYKLILPLIETDHLYLASLEDIGAMKLSAITSRSLNKDYVDLYFILQRLELIKLLELTKQKLPTIDTNLILKSLVYFDDVEQEPINFKAGHWISFQEVQSFLVDTVRSYFNSRPLS